MNTSVCSCCGKPLTVEESRRIGLGPVCAAKLRYREAELFHGGADFTWRIVNGCLCIVDPDRGGVSVTNAAAQVLESIYRDAPGVRGLPIVYQDSMGRVDIMEYKNGLVSFRAGGATFREAIAKTKQPRCTSKDVKTYADDQ